MVKVSYSEMRYIWNNGQHDMDIILQNLDWIFGNSCWLSTSPIICFEFLPRDSSDHSAMVVHSIGPLSRLKSSFKFMNL